MSLKAYYEYYLTLHKNNMCRRCHFIGQLFTVAYVFLVVLKLNLLFLLAAPFIVYPFAWFGHFYYEKNKPAAFSDPIKSKICDWLMFKDIITGKIKW